MPKDKPKPSPAEIKAADPLYRRDVADPIYCCNVCGQPSAELDAYQAHDGYDNPLPTPSSVGFIGHDHPTCLRKMQEHPRLYAHVTGSPGYFGRLCGPCRHRDGYRCTNPQAKMNGGPGLIATPDVPFTAIVCSRGRSSKLVRTILGCSGRETH